MSKKEIGKDTFYLINKYIEGNFNNRKSLEDIDLDEFSSECYLQITSGFGIDLDDLKVIRQLISSYREYQAYKKQCYPVSIEVMRNIIKLLSTDGINSKKEVIGILQTYITQEE